MASRSSCESVTTAVRSSIRSSTWSGQALTISSALGSRSSLASAGPAATTVVRRPGARALRAPAELPAVGGEVLGRLGGAEDQHSQRAFDDLGEKAVVPQARLLEEGLLEPPLTGPGFRVHHRV